MHVYGIHGNTLSYVTVTGAKDEMVRACRAGVIVSLCMSAIRKTVTWHRGGGGFGKIHVFNHIHVFTQSKGCTMSLYAKTNK